MSVSGKQPTTNYLKKDFDYQGHPTIENWLKVERIYINFKTSRTFSPRKSFGYAFFIAHKLSQAKMANFFITK